MLQLSQVLELFTNFSYQNPDTAHHLPPMFVIIGCCQIYDRVIGEVTKVPITRSLSVELADSTCLFANERQTCGPSNR